MASGYGSRLTAMTLRFLPSREPRAVNSPSWPRVRRNLTAALRAFSRRRSIIGAARCSGGLLTAFCSWFSRHTQSRLPHDAGETTSQRARPRGSPAHPARRSHVAPVHCSSGRIADALRPLSREHRVSTVTSCSSIGLRLGHPGDSLSRQRSILSAKRTTNARGDRRLAAASTNFAERIPRAALDARSARATKVHPRLVRRIAVHPVRWHADCLTGERRQFSLLDVGRRRHERWASTGSE